MHANTTRRSAGLVAILLTLGLGAAACTPLTNATSTDPPLRLPASPPSAVVIAGPRSSLTLPSIAAAITGSARTAEHLEVVDPASSANPVLTSTVAPASPVIAVPAPPVRPGHGATKYLMDQYHAQYQKYETKLGADQAALRRELGARLRSWSESIEAAVTHAPADSGNGVSARASLAQAEGFFGSLDQAGVALGNRKVLVLVAAPAMASTVTPLPPSSLAGVTVIVAGFTGSQMAEAEWQADFLQVGAIRAVVLSPGTQDELAPAITQGLDGETGPAPADVRFALDQAALDPAARTTLDGLATWLTSACSSAPVTILGFADPLGSPARNGQLAQQRARNTMAYLAGRGVSPARMFAAGYGAGLPAAPSNPRGVQPLDRRVVIVTNPVAGEPGC
jgi:outer membrane protein OmpA-like peptidoglycan-associated protein